MSVSEAVLAAGTSGQADAGGVVCLAVVLIIVLRAVFKAKGGS